MKLKVSGALALAWDKAKEKRGTFHRFIVAALIAPIFVMVAAPAPQAVAGVTSISAPQDVAVSNSGNNVNLTWTAPNYGTSLVTGYQVDYSSDGTTWTTASSAIGAGTLSYSITTGLTVGTSYYVRVSAKFSGGNSPYAYPWTKLYGTTTPIRSSNNIVYEPGYGLASAGNQASNTFSSATFTRVRYKMQYTSNSGGTFNYASADFSKWSAVTGNLYSNGTSYNSPAATIATLAFPDATTTNVIQAPVSDMTVESSNSALNNSSLSGRVEIWANDYSGPKGAVGATDGSDTAFDQNDRATSTTALGYGSFQVHDITNSNTILAWNDHNSATPDIGIGNNTNTCNASATPDWTFCGGYSSTSNFYYNSANRDNWKLEVFINVPIKVGTNGLLLRYDSKQYASYPGSGTTWNDVSGNGTNATLYNSLTTSAVSNGSFNISSMQFNGTNQYATIGGSFNYDFTAGISINFYANFGNASNWERIIDIGNANQDRNILVARVGTTQDLQFETYNNAGPLAPSTGSCKAISGIDDNTWTHWSIVLNGSTCAIYKNGSLYTGTTSTYVASTNTTTTGTSSAVAFAILPTSNVTRSNTYIGRSNWSADAYFEGGIADLAIFNRAISAAEVTSMQTIQKASTVYSDPATSKCPTQVSNPNNVTVTSTGTDCVVKFSAPSNTTTSKSFSGISVSKSPVVGHSGQSSFGGKKMRP